MAYVPKPQYSQFRHVLETTSKAIRYQEFDSLKDTVVSALESTGELVVNKVRRTERPGAIFEANCQWTGIDPDPEGVVRFLRQVWPGSEMKPTQEMHIIDIDGEQVILWFVAKGQDGGYISGRVLVVI